MEKGEGRHASPVDKGGLMGRYRKRSEVIEAHQWFKNGDHPEDDCGTFTDSQTGKPFQGEGKVVRYFRDPFVSGETVCDECGKTLHVHGWIDFPPSGVAVCPGSWIIKYGERYLPCDPKSFDRLYEPAGE